MSTSLQLVVLVLAVVTAVVAVALPIVRPPASPARSPELAPRDASRVRLLRAIEEIERDRRAGMISESDYDAALGEIRRRLARL